MSAVMLVPLLPLASDRHGAKNRRKDQRQAFDATSPSASSYLELGGAAISGSRTLSPMRGSYQERGMKVAPMNPEASLNSALSDEAPNKKATTENLTRRCFDTH